MFFGFFFLSLISHFSRADDVLPYTKRTQSYAGFANTVRGDLRTVGMAGAMVGLADSYVGVIDNPAGLAMTADSNGIQFSGNVIQDGFVQPYLAMVSSNNYSLMATPYPWGFGFSLWSPQEEADRFRFGSVGGDRIDVSLKIWEYRWAVARTFWDNRFSLGGALALSQARESMGFPEDTVVSGASVFTKDVYALGFTLGGLVQLPKRGLLGVSYISPLRQSFEAADQPGRGVENFYQPVQTPQRLAFGGAWIPNRVFRASAGMYFMGSMENTALMSDDSKTVGARWTAQPRVGLAYTAADFKYYKAYLHLGSYFESSRTAGYGDRMHFTGAVDLNLWFVNLGWGVDKAREYRNFIYTAGIDIGRFLRAFDLIPPEKRPPQAGFFPDPFYLSDAGLPRSLVKEWKPGEHNPNVIELGLQLPGRLQEKFTTAPADVWRVGGDVLNELGTLPGEFRDQMRLVPGVNLIPGLGPAPVLSAPPSMPAQK
ncbi:hypothetical protein WDW86_09020 [Bdellovibrionota bacterium FG-2]